MPDDESVSEVAYDSVDSGKPQKPPNVKHLCPKHGKPIEAFCLFDRQLLCIDCILSEDHKAKGNRERHEMIQVDKAAENEHEQLLAKYG